MIITQKISKNILFTHNNNLNILQKFILSILIIIFFLRNIFLI